MSDNQGAETPSAMPRPKRHDPAVLAIAAEKLAELICDDWDHDGERADWIETLKACPSYEWDDGYRFAKHLEDRHYVEADAALVDLLESAYSILSQAHEFALLQWTKYTNYVPQFSDGDRVVAARQGAGFINGVQAEKATYYFVPDSEVGSKFKSGGGYILSDADLTREAA